MLIKSGTEEFINQRIEEICCQEKSVKEVTYFVCERLRFVFSF